MRPIVGKCLLVNSIPLLFRRPLGLITINPRVHGLIFSTTVYPIESSRITLVDPSISLDSSLLEVYLLLLWTINFPKHRLINNSVLSFIRPSATSHYHALVLTDWRCLDIVPASSGSHPLWMLAAGNPTI